MKRQSATAVSNGKSGSNGHVQGGTKDDVSNGNLSPRARNGDAKSAHKNGGVSKTSNQQNHAEAANTSAQSSGVFQFFCRTFVPLFLMFFSPNLVILIWYVIARCGGSWLKLLNLFAIEGFLGAITRIWSEIHIASPLSCAVLIGYILFALILQVSLPGRRTEGPVTPFGNVPVYRDNGFFCYVVTMVVFAILAVLLPRYTPYSVTIVYDHFDEFLGTLTVFSHVLCIFLHLKGLLWPSSTDCGTSGNLIFDYYWGTELYPRVFGVDIKVFTNCRFGMTVWALLVATFAVKSYELHGFVDSAWVSTGLQLIYITKFFWWEDGYMRTIDIMLDRAGFYICWGCLCYIAGVYASVSLYLPTHPVHLGTPVAAGIFALGVASCFINYDADRQKLEVRRTNAQNEVWGKKPEVIRAEYKVADGSVRTSILLVSGYWGIARHFHYLPELSLAFLWSVPFGFENVMPFTYFIWLCALLTHRTFRDDTKCREKYGKYWDEYCRRVPYKMLPYIF